jgi:hypothetical protein
MTTTKETCKECCHVASVGLGCEAWACAQCGRVQLTQTGAERIKDWPEYRKVEYLAVLRREKKKP